jgi:hypothetical protein
MKTYLALAIAGFALLTATYGRWKLARYSFSSVLPSA